MLSNTSDAIICMTENQVNDIRLIFKEKIQRKSIQLPPTYSLNRWLQKEYQEFCMVGPINESYNILNGIEEKLLWGKIIKNDLKLKKLLKKQIDDIAEKVISADRLIREYRINKNELKKNETYHEMRCFNEWHTQFNNHCNENKLLSRHGFIEFFIEKQKEYKIVDNQDLCLVGFDHNSPLYQELINTLKERNKVKNYKNQQDKVKKRKMLCENVGEEIKEVMEWIKKNSKKKLLIISPALSRFQIKLQNEIDRQIQPGIYREYNKNNIYNSNLKRPLSNEPIITAAINLLKLNHPHHINPKLIYESLLFNNWIDSEGYKDREKLANYIRDKKIPKITINSLSKLIKKDSKIKGLSLNSLTDTLFLIEKNQVLWKKKKVINEWIALTEQYWDVIKISKINNLLTFEINNINSLFKSLNQLKNNKIIDYSVEFDEYWEILFTQLASTPAPKDDNDFYIDINGYAENPIKKYDAIWLMNMNANFWPGKTEFNPFIPKKLQIKYHIFDEVYINEVDGIRQGRLENFGPDITISHSMMDGETLLIPSPFFDDLKTEKISPRIPEVDSKQYQAIEKVENHKAPEILGVDINVSSGFRCLENFQTCPAWAFYENRLHAKPYQEDDQEEISKMSRGNLMHELLEKFWKEHKSSSNLAKMTEKALLKNIEVLIQETMSSYQVSKSYISPRQIKLESDYFKDLLYQWLLYEKTERPRFSVIEFEKKYPVKIDRIIFNVKIDRIDQYKDGSRLLIDYKTGNVAPISQWKKSPIKSLQIPIYSAFTGIKNISAAGIGYIHNKDVKLVGLSSYAQDPIDGGLTDCSTSKKDEGQWQYLIKSWRHDIYRLASGYLSGDARVTYTKEEELKYCAVKPLLRIAERKWQFENPDE